MPETVRPDGRPTLVLLHGVGGNAAGFASLVAEFHQLGWPAVAWSQPGYDGTPVVEPYDLDTCARALAAWMGQRAPGQVVLVGHSMGGMLAQSLHAQLPAAQSGLSEPSQARPSQPHSTQPQPSQPRPFRIAGLVLAHTSPAFGNAGGDFQQRFIESRTRPLDEGLTMRSLAARLVPGMMAPAASGQARAAAIDMMAAVPADTYRLAVAAIAGFDGRRHLADIRVPTLCLAAEHDTTSSPAVLQKMAQRIAGADYHCLEGLGHLAPIEDPRRWAATVADWCRRRVPGDS